MLIFPEGNLFIGTEIKPFKAGAGFIAVQGRLPVVPVRLRVHDFGSPTRFPLLRRGRVEIRFGAPLTFPSGTPYDEAARSIEDAVRAL